MAEWEVSLMVSSCEDCVYADIAYWDQDTKTGKATPTYWCENHKQFCEDIQNCEPLKMSEVME